MTAEVKNLQQQPQQAKVPTMHPMQALQSIQQSLMAINSHSIMIQQVTGAKIEVIKDNLVNIANNIDALSRWMSDDLKLLPSQPMNRQQNRRIQKELNKNKQDKQ